MWLEAVQEALRRGLERPAPWPPLEQIIPRDRLRRVAREALEAPALPDGSRLELSKRWLRPAALPGWALARLCLRGLDAESSPEELRALIEAVLTRAIWRETPVLEGTATLLEPYVDLDRGPDGVDELVYVHEAGLMVRGQTTPVGRVLSELRGRPALRWLLANELHRSTGPSDPWRLSRSTATFLVDSPSLTYFDPYDPYPKDWPFDVRTLARLHELALLGFDDDNGYQHYAVGLEGRELLAELISSRSPMEAALGALVEQETSGIVAGRPLTAGLDRGAAQWVVETMAHGLRNALVPASSDLQFLTGASSERDRAPAERALAGVSRALKLVSDLVGLYQSAHAPAEWFGLRSALLDAVAAANGSGVTLDIDHGEAQLRGWRLRFVHAVAELIRNARHHGPQGGRVAIASERRAGSALVHVDDEGSGVAPALLPRIFERGFSTRPDGTGQGLALLRDVIESEMNGRIHVSRAPNLGGARFTLEVPVLLESSSS